MRLLIGTASRYGDVMMSKITAVISVIRCAGASTYRALMAAVLLLLVTRIAAQVPVMRLTDGAVCHGERNGNSVFGLEPSLVHRRGSKLKHRLLEKRFGARIR
jgi:phosphosulfolactate phosphohydrolase-like enzyme